MKTIDARVVKTNEKLFTAYIQLLSSNSPETISVQQLTNLANINRVTFYKRYEHLADFQATFTEHYIMALYEFMKPLNYKAYSPGFEYEVLVQLLTFIYEHAETYKVLFTSKFSTHFLQELLQFFQQKVSKHTEDLALFDFPGTGVDKNIVAWYGVSALFGTILMWVSQNFPYSPEQLATSITKLNGHP